MESLSSTSSEPPRPLHSLPFPPSIDVSKFLHERAAEVRHTLGDLVRERKRELADPYDERGGEASGIRTSTTIAPDDLSAKIPRYLRRRIGSHSSRQKVFALKRNKKVQTSQLTSSASASQLSVPTSEGSMLPPSKVTGNGSVLTKPCRRLRRHFDLKVQRPKGPTPARVAFDPSIFSINNVQFGLEFAERERKVLEDLREDSLLRKNEEEREKRGPMEGCYVTFRRLRSHVWHAKRVKMAKRWGWCLAEGMTGEGMNTGAVSKCLKNSCLLHDASYCSSVQLDGSESEIRSVLRLLTDPGSLPATCHLRMSRGSSKKSDHDTWLFTNGFVECDLTMYKVGAFPLSAIGPVSFLWKFPGKRKAGGVETTQNSLENRRSAWLTLHPAMYDEAVGELKKAVSAVNEKFGNPAHKQPPGRSPVSIRERREDLCRVEIFGKENEAGSLLSALLSERVVKSERAGVGEKRGEERAAEKWEGEREEFFSHLSSLSCSVVSRSVRDPRESMYEKSGMGRIWVKEEGEKGDNGERKSEETREAEGGEERERELLELNGDEGRREGLSRNERNEGGEKRGESANEGDREMEGKGDSKQKRRKREKREKKERKRRGREARDEFYYALLSEMYGNCNSLWALEKADSPNLPLSDAQLTERQAQLKKSYFSLCGTVGESSTAAPSSTLGSSFSPSFLSPSPASLSPPLFSSLVRSPHENCCPVIVAKRFLGRKSEMEGAYFFWTLILPSDWFHAFWESAHWLLKGRVGAFESVEEETEVKGRRRDPGKRSDKCSAGVGGGVRAIGQRERRWILTNFGIPAFPFDFPETSSYKGHVAISYWSEKQVYLSKPKGKREMLPPLPPAWEFISERTKERAKDSINVEGVKAGQFGGEKTGEEEAEKKGEKGSRGQRRESGGVHVSRSAGDHLSLLFGGEKVHFQKIDESDDAEFLSVRRWCQASIVVPGRGRAEEGAEICEPTRKDFESWTTTGSTFHGVPRERERRLGPLPDSLLTKRQKRKKMSKRLEAKRAEVRTEAEKGGRAMGSECQVFAENDKTTSEILEASVATRRERRRIFGFVTSEDALNRHQSPISLGVCDAATCRFLVSSQFSDRYCSTPWDRIGWKGSAPSSLQLFVLVRNPGSDMYRPAVLKLV